MEALSSVLAISSLSVTAKKLLMHCKPMLVKEVIMTGYLCYAQIGIFNFVWCIVVKTQVAGTLILATVTRGGGVIHPVHIPIPSS